MEHVSQSCGIPVGNAWFADLDYADRCCAFRLFAERQELLASALQSMEEESSMFGLHISWSKTMKVPSPSLGSWT